MKIQYYIPIVKDAQFKNMKLSEIKNYVKDYYNNNLRGLTVKNEALGVSVIFSRKGLDHLLYARNAGYVKLKAVVELRDMIRFAVWVNNTNPDAKDIKNGIVGWQNFQVKVNVEGKDELFRISIKITKEGEFYYDHSVRVKK